METIETRSEQVILKLSPHEKQVFQEIASSRGLDLTQWIRDVLRDMAEVEYEITGKERLIFRPIRAINRTKLLDTA